MSRVGLIERYRDRLPFAPEDPVVSLLEGSTPLIEAIVAAWPRRIIFNPGAENEELAAAAREAGIEVVEGCTLVMLRTGTF